MPDTKAIILAPIFAAALLSSCATGSYYNQTSAYPSQKEFEQQRSAEFYAAATRFTERLDGERQAEGYSFGTGNNVALLRSFGSASRWRSHQLYVTRYYRGDWHRFSGAGAFGRPLEFVSINRSVVYCSGRGSGCLFAETFAAELSEIDLIQSAQDGLTVEFYAQSGHTHTTVLPDRAVRGYTDSLGITSTDISAAPPETTI